MSDGQFRVPTPINEPVTAFEPGSSAREKLDAALAQVASEHLDMGAVIDGEIVRSGDTENVVMPHDHAHVLGVVHNTTAGDTQRAIDGALTVAPAWRAMPYAERAAIFLRAAALLEGPWRMRINAACMLGQSKTCHQAEIDAACELIDFFRFNALFGQRILAEQPISPRGYWNRSDYRPLEGFVFAVTPFNFLSIAVNLPAAPALMGNVVLWKPSTTGMVGAWHCLQLLKEAGLPDGVIQLVPGDGKTQGDVALASEHLAGIHFTGSTATFKHLWKSVGQGIDRYRSFPRVVGETGGKDFILFHPSVNLDEAATAIVRGAFEYQGQKCSAASRVYIPKSIYGQLETRVCDMMGELTMGDVRDYSNFLGAVIDKRAFDKISGYQQLGKDTADVRKGGSANEDKGYFIEPTFVRVDDAKHRLMSEEIFGPLVTAYVFEDSAFEDMFDTIDSTSPYALTGAVFAKDRGVIHRASEALRFSAGNFYINDKPTGAVVGQQPFGGARGSGTNDKAGAMWNLMRWTSPRSIKENQSPPRDWRYTFLNK